MFSLTCMQLLFYLYRTQAIWICETRYHKFCFSSDEELASGQNVSAICCDFIL